MEPERNLLDGKITGREILHGIWNPRQLEASLYRYYRSYVQRPFGKYEGTRIFVPHWQNKLLEKLMSQPGLQKAIERIASRQVADEKLLVKGDAREQLRSKYERWLMEVVRDLSDKALPCIESEMVVRFMYHTVAEIFSRSYQKGMFVRETDIKRVKEKAKELQSKKQSLLLFPCHKSHVDYVSLVFAFYNLGISLPCTIAGDNLDLPILSYFLRHVGATYIRRGNWSEDPLYHAFFQNMLNTFLSEGLNLQCFIEGTRSRTGKLLPPRLGILRMILEAILNGVVEDAWVLPISTHYDKVFEADDYAMQLLGRTKKGESLLSVLESASIISLRLGRIDIRFGEIWSLRQYVVDQLQLESASSFPLPRPLPLNRIQLLTRSFGYRILNDINKVAVIMPSALVGTALLTSGRRGLDRSELMSRVASIIGLVNDAHGSLGGIPKPATQLTGEDIVSVVDAAVDVLGPSLVEIECDELYKSIYRPKDEFKLSYYRNQTLHVFRKQSIASLAIYTLSQKTDSIRLPYADLVTEIDFLNNLLVGEFVSETAALDDDLLGTLSGLQEQGIIYCGSTELEMTSVRADFVRSTGGFYCHLLWPYIDAYWNVCFCLLLFTDLLKSGLSERKFCRIAQTIARNLYGEGHVHYSEVCNGEIIKTSLLAFERLGVLSREKEPRDHKLLMTDAYSKEVDNTCLSTPLYRLCQDIAICRNVYSNVTITTKLTRELIQSCAPIVSLNASKI